MDQSKTKPLAGKNALITGGSRSIGAAIARRLAADGAAVVITHHASTGKAEQVVRAIKDSGGNALAIQADSADPEAIRSAVLKTVEVLGSIDILVNNAGALSIAPIEKFSLADFDRMMAVNVRGVFIATQEAAKHMKQGGRIIHIGSCNSDRTPFGGASVYSLTKGAVAAFTKGLARDLGPRGITVNNVQPGPTDTEMNPDSGEFADLNRSFTALGRYAKAEEIANFVAFLASPESSFITGASLLVDGGYTA